jgi:2-aminoadipate transaminase
MNASPFTFAGRAARLSPSMIRELMKFIGRPGLVSLGGGLPSADCFPTSALRSASQRVLERASAQALQYTTTEGLPVLREWVAARLRQRGMSVDAGQVLITSGSQQGLDLVGKLLLEKGSKVAVEVPTYLGAMQAFAPYESDIVEVDCDGSGPLPESLLSVAGARALYVLPNFQNPTGRCMPDARRRQVADRARTLGIPLIEDDPYGDLWFDHTPPAPMAVHWPEGTIYLGSFSKVLAPGLRLGYVVAPPALMDRLVQAKQAADLHSGTFAQHLVADLLGTGMLDDHLQQVRARYREGRDAMARALDVHLHGLASWQVPAGGMFFWLTLAGGLDSAALLPAAVDKGVSFVPGAPFFARSAESPAIRLSFATEPAERIDQGVSALAEVVRHAMAGQRAQH